MRDANRVENPNVPQLALAAQLVDGGGADAERSRHLSNGE